MNPLCANCKKPCKEAFSQVCSCLGQDLRDFMEDAFLPIVIQTWDEDNIPFLELQRHGVFLFFWDYVLHNGRSVSLGKYVKETNDDPIYKDIESITYHPKYQQLKRYFERRSKTHDVEKKPSSIYDIIAADFILSLREKDKFFNFAFEDRMPEKKNYPSLSEKGLLNSLKVIKQIYQGILSSTDSYFLKSLKFYLMEHLTYLEHNIFLAKHMKAFVPDKDRNEYSLYAYNLRYVKEAETERLVFFPFMIGYQNLFAWYFDNPNSSIEDKSIDVCKFLGHQTLLVKSAVYQTKLELEENLITQAYDVESCPCAETFFEHFFGRGQHIVQYEHGDFIYDTIRIMYQKEPQFESFLELTAKQKSKKQALNARRTQKSK